MITEEIKKFLIEKLEKDFKDNPDLLIENKRRFETIWLEECNKESISKCISKMNNDSISGFERTKAWGILEFFSDYKLGQHGFFAESIYNLTKSFENVDWKKLSADEFSMMLENNDFHVFTYLLNQGIVFDIPEYLQDLFIETDIEQKFKDKLFYNLLFLDLKNFRLSENIVLFGIILHQGIDKEKNFILKITAIGKDLNDGECIYIIDYLTKEGIGLPYIVTDVSFLSKEEHRKNFHKILRIVLNFINFLNHPEVELILHDKSYIRKNRIDKGKFGVPDIVEINITGKLKKYIDEISNENKINRNLGYKFWVRGHWVNFKNDRYKNAKGTQVWILPYIKGKGELIKKNYHLGKREDWYHQQRMKEILLNIYPDKKIIKSRILNGLEIDSYIPELKLGFEYNGEQHYIYPNNFHKSKGEFEAQQERDILKNKIAIEKGIRLITIRYDEILSEELILSKIDS